MSKISEYSASEKEDLVVSLATLILADTETAVSVRLNSWIFHSKIIFVLFDL